MRARHEFVSDKKYYDYVRVQATIEFIKSAIMADNADEDTVCENAVKLSNTMIQELIKNKDVNGTTT